MIGYKLTNKDYTTYGGCKWGKNVTHTTNGEGELCGPGWLHYYEHPLLAVLHNPIHGDFLRPILWKAKVEGSIKHDGQVKSGCTKLTTLTQMKLPEITPSQKVAYGIFCALEVYTDTKFTQWANDWLSGKDRTSDAADVIIRDANRAYCIAHDIVNAAYIANTIDNVANAAADAANAASSAANAAYDAYIALTTYDNSYRIAITVADVIEFASRSDNKPNFIACAKKAMKIK